jgi:RTX calcium-binding nonapeptide repeat (4 copies)
VSYGGPAPLRLSIGDGPNDGVAGEGDDILGDVEGLNGGPGDDILVGDDDPNRLSGYAGRDVLRGRGGRDELLGWGDGDELDGGAGTDSVSTRPRRLRSELDRALLADGEADTLACDGAAPFIEADAIDNLDVCAPSVVVHRRGGMRHHRQATLFVRCPAQTAVPCRGRLWIHLPGTRRDPQGGRRLTRAVRFGPIAAGKRERLQILIRGRLPRHGCVFSTAVTRRDDGVDARTIANNVLRCLPG